MHQWNGYVYVPPMAGMSDCSVADDRPTEPVVRLRWPPCSSSSVQSHTHPLVPVYVMMQIWSVSTKAKPKTYTFFFLGRAIGAARSSAGGVSLLVRNP